MDTARPLSSDPRAAVAEMIRLADERARALLAERGIPVTEERLDRAVEALFGAVFAEILGTVGPADARALRAARSAMEAEAAEEAGR